MEPNEEFIRRLETGYRMEKPQYASDDLWVVFLDAIASLELMSNDT